MGKKGTRDRQASMWVATADLPKSAGHPFYARLNRVLDDAGFDTFVEAQCAPFYADGIGRPSLAPGRDVRLLLLGYFEGLDSERAIAWRAADSLSIRQFLDFALHEAPPDHSTLSRTRRLIDVETHQAVFTWVLQRLADAHLVEGHTIGIDATTLEANAAMRSIVRRDTGKAYEAWLTRLADASGIATPTRAELARFDRKRKKKGSNEDWTNPHDPDAKITKMKDGRTHLAHTAEHAVDLETGAIVGVTVQDADAGDTTTMVETLIEAADQLAAVDGASGIAEVVGDKGYHSNETMVGCADLGVRSYVSEPDRGRRKWKGKAAAKKAVYANRRRIRGHRGQRLLRQRGELLERPNAHLYETGRMRRVHLRGHANILTRLLVHVCGANLGLLMRQLTGVGTPRSLQGRAAALLGALINLLGGLCERLKRSWAPEAPDAPDSSWGRPRQVNTNTRSSIYEEPLLPRAARLDVQCGNEGLVLGIRLKDDQSLVNDRRARVAPLGTRIEEPAAVEHADVDFPQQRAGHVVAHHQPDGAEDCDDVLSVGHRGRVRLAALRVAFGPGLPLVHQPLPADRPAQPVKTVNVPAVGREVVHGPGLTVLPDSERVVPGTADRRRHEHLVAPDNRCGVREAGNWCLPRDVLAGLGVPRRGGPLAIRHAGRARSAEPRPGSWCCSGRIW